MAELAELKNYSTLSAIEKSFWGLTRKNLLKCRRPDNVNLTKTFHVNGTFNYLIFTHLITR